MRCHPPNLCSVRFVTFMDSSKANYVLETIYKRFGIAKDPPLCPWMGLHSTFYTECVGRLPYALARELSLLTTFNKFVSELEL